MQAMVFSTYGASNVLELKEIDRPEPQDKEVLIKVCAVSINDWDWGLLQGKPFVNRMMNGLCKPKRTQVLGSDVAGRVISIGKGVTQFTLGDEVFGDLSGCGWGGFAEYVCAPAQALTLKPSTMTFEQAAAMPQAALLALQGLSDKNQVHAGQKVLINGAGGGAGSFAIQIAHNFGAEVTGVDCAAKFALMRALGAEHVIDYKKEDFSRNGQHYDLILDLMGYHSLTDYRRALTPTGRYVLVGGSSGLIFKVLIASSFFSLISAKKMRILALEANEGMQELIELFASGKVVPLIDKCYSLSELGVAMDYFAVRHCKGKVVITLP